MQEPWTFDEEMMQDRFNDYDPDEAEYLAEREYQRMKDDGEL